MYSPYLAMDHCINTYGNVCSWTDRTHPSDSKEKTKRTYFEFDSILEIIEAMRMDGITK